MSRQAISNRLKVFMLVLILPALGACGGNDTTPDTPAAPTNVTATPGPGYVTVEWQDNSDNETGFVIYRSTGAASAVTTQQAGTEVGTVGANEERFIDRDIEVGQSYRYSVVAENAEGASEEEAGSEAATVEPGVDLIIGTNNRRLSETDNGTIILLYFVFPQEVLEDEGIPFEVSITGPNSWNDNQPYSYTHNANSYARDRGFTFISENGITAISGSYILRVTVDGVTYEASASLDDASYKFPRPTDLTITDSSSSSVSLSWTPPEGSRSAWLSIHRSNYDGLIVGYELSTGSSHTFDDLSLEDGLYQVEIAPLNVDLSEYPVKTAPFGISYDTVSFAVGDVISPECSSPGDLVAIPDLKLEAAVRDELGIASDDLTCLDMALLQELDAQDAGIENLEGLQYAVNLSYAQFDNNSIGDPSPLADLVSMRYLWLGGNALTDVSVIANLTELEGISLWSNPLSSFEPLRNLTRLRMAFIGDTDVSDVTPLENLTELEMLHLGDTDLSGSDLGFLAAFTNLSELRLEHTGISSAAPLDNLTALTQLWLQGNNLSDLAPLVQNSGLGEGDEVDVSSNLLDLNDPGVQSDIQALLDRGVDLSYEPQREN